MNLAEIVEKAGLHIFYGENMDNRIVTGGYTSDLLSDVIGYANAGKVWITLQTHKNVMAIASLKELAAVILVKGYSPEPDMLEQSKAEGIPVLGTGKEAFEISGILYNLMAE